MKQYISERQFKKLSLRTQRKLKQWTIDKGYAIESLPGELGYGYQFEPEDDGKIWTVYPSLSIGQLIEFLVDRKKDLHIERYDGGKKYSHWSISTCFDEKWKFGKEYTELCDSLWEAVKKELAR
ncbi:hypothetical protein HYW43_01085 [Candidatus Daviesbacteria bacterium]|nr:hypothetical protein [Candidatus Daviesbacteria bacterium]